MPGGGEAAQPKAFQREGKASDCFSGGTGNHRQWRTGREAVPAQWFCAAKPFQRISECTRAARPIDHLPPPFACLLEVRERHINRTGGKNKPRLAKPRFAPPLSH